jgi:hypothetical protein
MFQNTKRNWLVEILCYYRSLFDFHNLLTESNKMSYIDTYLQRGVNATEVSVGLNNVMQGYDNKYAWFLG